MVGGCPGKDALGSLVPELPGWKGRDLPLRNSSNGQGERGRNVLGWMRKNSGITIKSKKNTQSYPCHFAGEDKMEGCFYLKLNIKTLGNKDEVRKPQR